MLGLWTSQWGNCHKKNTRTGLLLQVMLTANGNAWDITFYLMVTPQTGIRPGGQSTHYFIYRDGKQGKLWNNLSQTASIPVIFREFSSALCFAGRLALSWAVPDEHSACQRLREPDLNEYASSHGFVKIKARLPLCWVLHASEKSCLLLRLNTTTSGKKEAKIFPIMKGGKRHRESSQPLQCHTTSLGTKALLHPQDKSTFSPCSHSSREQLPSYQCWMPVKVSLFFLVQGISLPFIL